MANLLPGKNSNKRHVVFNYVSFRDLECRHSRIYILISFSFRILKLIREKLIILQF